VIVCREGCWSEGVVVLVDVEVGVEVVKLCLCYHSQVVLMKE
jgi:hypothetical protein